jgi:hypothetical protein
LDIQGLEAFGATMKKFIVILILLWASLAFADNYEIHDWGVLIPDNYAVYFGDDEDFRLSYDEAIGGALELTDGTNTFASVTDNGTTATVAITGDLAVSGAFTAGSFSFTNISADTYGSDGSVSDAELLYINTLSSNAQTQLNARCLESVFGTSIGDGLLLDGTTLKASAALQALALKTIGIANGNLVTIDQADAASGEYARLTASGIESRSKAETQSDLDLEAGTDFYSKTAEDTWRSSVTQTVMGYLSGATSDIQTQLNGKAATTRKLDDFGTPDDNTDLNATTTYHGLLPKLNNSATDFLNGQGAWAAPAGSGTAVYTEVDTAGELGTALVAGDAWVMVTGDITLDGAETVQAGTTLSFVPGAVISMGNFDLIIYGMIEAGDAQQIFDEDGSGKARVAYSAGTCSNKEAFANWWGMNIDNANNAAYLQDAIDSASSTTGVNPTYNVPIVVSPGNYIFTSGVTIGNGSTHLRGSSDVWQNTQLRSTYAGPLFTVTQADVKISDFSMYFTAATNTSSKGVYFNANEINGLSVFNTTFYAFEIGVHIYGNSYYNKIFDCYFSNCGSKTAKAGQAIYTSPATTTGSEVGAELTVSRCHIHNSTATSSTGAMYGILLSRADTVSISDTDILGFGATAEYSFHNYAVFFEGGGTVSNGSGHHISNSYIEAGYYGAVGVTGDEDGDFGTLFISDSYLSKRSIGVTDSACLVVTSGQMVLSNIFLASGSSSDDDVLFVTDNTYSGTVNISMTDCISTSGSANLFRTDNDGASALLYLTMSGPIIAPGVDTTLVNASSLTSSKVKKVSIIGGNDLSGITSITTGVPDSALAMFTTEKVVTPPVVGIGTSSNSSYYTRANEFVIYDDDYAGMTIATPTNKSGAIVFADGTSGADAYRGVIEYNHATNAFYLATNGVNYMQLDSSGITMLNSAACCDFVMSPAYKLMTLDDLDDFIDKESYLPGMTINKGGQLNMSVSVNELLIKTEEQALYILQLHNRLKSLEDNLNKLVCD